MTAQPNASLRHGLDCLQAVASASGPVGSREVARWLGLHPTRANRLLRTLADLGLLARDTARKYRSGPGLHLLAAQSLTASGLLPAALPELRNWHSEGFTIAIGVLWRDLVCFLVHARAEQRLGDAIGSHPVCPADVSSLGLALFAARDDPPAIRSGPLHAALADPPPLADALADARRDGYALRRYRDGTTSIGVGIGALPTAGLAVSHRAMDEDRIRDVAVRLAAAAQRIAAALPAAHAVHEPEGVLL